MLQAESTAHAKALGQDQARYVGGTARRPVCLERNERGGESGRREGCGGGGFTVPCGTQRGLELFLKERKWGWF